MEISPDQLERLAAKRRYTYYEILPRHGDKPVAVVRKAPDPPHEAAVGILVRMSCRAGGEPDKVEVRRLDETWDETTIFDRWQRGHEHREPVEVPPQMVWASRK